MRTETRTTTGSVSRIVEQLKKQLREKRNLAQKLNSGITESVNLKGGLDFQWRTYFEVERKKTLKEVDELIRAIEILKDWNKLS